jgi:RluA family pseudouridine synthase
VVHRLDKETSGVMLFARHTAAQRHLSHQFQNNTVRKEYLALVMGRPTEESGEVDAPIGAHPTSSKKMAVLKHGGRPARTLWRVRQSFRNFTLLRVLPRTGKTHQIRVHLAHIGLPIAVDPMYNSHPGPLLLSQIKRGYRAKRDEEERPLLARLALHAEKLRFVHLRGVDIELAAPVPRDMKATVNMLGKYDR